MSIYGVDYATPYLNVARLKISGVKFVARYLAPKDQAYAWKRLTRAEVAVLRTAGIQIVSVFESSSTRAKLGYAAGVADAQSALSHLLEVGATVGAPVYFAVDYDAQSSDFPSILKYFQATKVKFKHVGCYGPYDLIDYLRAHGACDYYWQAYAPAWSHGRNAQRNRAANIQQIGGRKFGGLSVDNDYAFTADYGQWNPPKPPKPPPPIPPPKPKPKPRPLHAKRFLVQATYKDDSIHWIPSGRVGVAYIFSRFLAGKYKAISISR